MKAASSRSTATGIAGAPRGQRTPGGTSCSTQPAGASSGSVVEAELGGVGGPVVLAGRQDALDVVARLLEGHVRGDLELLALGGGFGAPLVDLALPAVVGGERQDRVALVLVEQV